MFGINMEIKICKCGCMQKVSNSTDYIFNHDKQEIISCACGCGQKLFKYGRNGKERNIIYYHIMEKICKCGCGNKFMSGKKDYIANHKHQEKIICACGCGQQLYKYDKFGCKRTSLLYHHQKNIAYWASKKIEQKRRSYIKIRKECKCGCGNITGKKEYIRNHDKQELINCACGCGQQLYKYDKKGNKRIRLLYHLCQIKRTLKICKCGCNKKFLSQSDYILNHDKQEIIECACGCRQKMFKYNGQGRPVIYIHNHKVYESYLEFKLQKYLNELDIVFIKQKHMDILHSYCCDIFIPSKNLVIECDGEHWHNFPLGKEVDHIRTKELLDKGFKVLRLWEREIRSITIEEFRNKIESI